ncbi:MAG: metalloregulator ArsR/SmtB family transcription factor [Pirellulales bacterium]
MVDNTEYCSESPEKAGKQASLQTCERTAALFRVLGDLNRLRLLSLLCHREMCVSELTEALQDNLPAISQRLKLLRSEQLVQTRREGKHVYYRLTDRKLVQLIRNGLAHAEKRSPQTAN